MKKQFCPYCGGKLEGDFSFCPYCGKGLLGDEREKEEIQQDKKGKVSAEAEQVMREFEAQFAEAKVRNSAMKQHGSKFSSGSMSSTGQYIMIGMMSLFFILLLVGLYFLKNFLEAYIQRGGLGAGT